MSVIDQYCEKCDVFGHEEGTDPCHEYWTTTEEPFRERMQRQVGKVFKLSGTGPDFFSVEDGTTLYDSYRLGAGTFIRLTHYEPWKPGAKVGNFWCIETLDGKFTASQVYQDEIEELGPLDKLALIKEDG